MEPPTISPTPGTGIFVSFGSWNGSEFRKKKRLTEDIDGLGNAEIVGVLLHVESLDLDGEVGEKDRAVDDVSHPALGSLGDIVTEDVGVALLVEDRGILLVEPLDGLLVLHAEELLGLLELGVENLEVTGSSLVVENTVDDLGDDLLEMVEKVAELDKVYLGLDVGVLGQVATGKRLLGTERLLNAVDLAHGSKDGLEVQLGGLGKVGLLAVVVVLEEGRTTLDLGLDHGRGRDLAELELTVGIDESQLDELAELHESRGVLATEDQVPVVKHGSIPSILVTGDLVGDGLGVAGGVAEDLEVVDLKLTAIGGSGTGRELLELTVEDEGGLLGEQESVVVLGEVASGQDALEEAVAVLEGKEGGVLLGAETVDAAIDLDAGALLGLIAELDGLVVETDADGLGQGRVLLENDLLGVLEVLETLLALLLLLLEGLLLLLQLLLVLVDAADGLLHGALGGLLPCWAIGRALLGGDLGEVCGRGLIEVLDEGVVQRLEGLGLGAIGRLVVLAGDRVDVDLGLAFCAIGELLWCRHFGNICRVAKRDKTRPKI